MHRVRTCPSQASAPGRCLVKSAPEPWTLALGYRHIDTAAAYNNEDAVGQALVNSPTPREHVHVTSKAWWDQLQPDAITPYTLTDEALIRSEITLATERGYVMVDQEYEVGMRVLSVPLINREGQLQATLTLTTHASRMTVEDMRERYLSALYEGQALLRPIMTH